MQIFYFIFTYNPCKLLDLLDSGWVSWHPNLMKQFVKVAFNVPQNDFFTTIE